MSNTIPAAGSRIALSINHGTIQHPLYGTATLSSKIPLFLPQGEYTTPAILSNETELDKLANQLTPKYSDLWPNDLDSEIAARIKELIKLVACITPDPDFTQLPVLLGLELYILAFASDDTLDNLGSDQAVKISDYKFIMEAMAGVFSGKYKQVEDLPSIAPAFEAYIKYAWNFIKKCESSNPNWQKDWVVLLRKFEEDALGNVLLLEAEQEFSEESRDFFQTYAAGGNSSLEFVVAAKGITLPEGVESNLLFQRMRYCIASTSNLLNDVIGIRRDIEKGQTKDTSILMGVSRRMSLQEAYDNTERILIQNMNDTRVAIKKLGQLYENEEVRKYLWLVQHYLDGQFVWCTLSERYGETGARIVEI